jgi:hypothetical protein
MKNDSGLLSIDFIAGFTIFMIAFIIVVTMVSGLLVSLQSRTIDYDALAYRTGVILTEDAGDPGGAGDLNDNAPGTGWEIKNLGSSQEKKEIIRLGLALSKNYPNILSSVKVDKFFNKNDGLTVDEYLAYRQKLMLFNFNNQYLSITPTFYHFNIRLQSIENPSDFPKDSVPHLTTSPLYNSLKYVGDDDSNVQNYGYSRRVVKIKQPSSMNVNLSYPPGEPAVKKFSVQYDEDEFNSTLGLLMGLRYNIDPYNEQTAINVTLNNSASVTLDRVQVVQYLPNSGTETAVDISYTSPTVKVYLNTNNTDGSRWVNGDTTPIFPNSNVLMVVEPGFIGGRGLSVINKSSMSLRCTFSDNVTARVDPILYSYTEWTPPVWDSVNSTWLPSNLIQNPNLTMPFLIPAVLEVKVW